MLGLLGNNKHVINADPKLVLLRIIRPWRGEHTEVPVRGSGNHIPHQPSAVHIHGPLACRKVLDTLGLVNRRIPGILIGGKL